MKQYLDSQDIENYILSFKEKGNKIIIYLASGEKRYVENSQPNREILLNKMEEQFKEVDDPNYDSKLIIANRITFKSIITYFTLFILTFGGAIITPHVFKILFCIASSFSLYVVIMCTRNYISNHQKAHDFFKISYFLERENIFNDRTLVNENSIENLKNKTKKVINNNLQDKTREVLDINTVSKISFNEFERLANNIFFNETYGLDAEKTPEKDDFGIQRVRKK